MFYFSSHLYICMHLLALFAPVSGIHKPLLHVQVWVGTQVFCWTWCRPYGFPRTSSFQWLTAKTGKREQTLYSFELIIPANAVMWLVQVILKRLKELLERKHTHKFRPFLCKKNVRSWPLCLNDNALPFLLLYFCLTTLLNNLAQYFSRLNHWTSFVVIESTRQASNNAVTLAILII